MASSEFLTGAMYSSSFEGPASTYTRWTRRALVLFVLLALGVVYVIVEGPAILCPVVDVAVDLP